MLWCVCVRKNKQGLKEKQSAKPFCLYRAVGVYNALFLVLFFCETYDSTTSYQVLVEHHFPCVVGLASHTFLRENKLRKLQNYYDDDNDNDNDKYHSNNNGNNNQQFPCYATAYIDDILLTDHSTIRKKVSTNNFRRQRQYVNRFRQTISDDKDNT